MRRELEAERKYFERALRRENAPKGSRGFGVDYLFIEDISLMPPGSRIEPPIPPGNPMGLDLLDHLCK